MNRRSSLRSSSDRRPGSVLERLVGVEVVDGLLEAVAADEPHGVIGPAVAVGAQAVDRDDPRVLQPAGDLGLEQEPLAAGGVVGVVVEDLLERHLAVQLGVQRHEDGAQAAPGVGPQDAEPLAVAGGRADGVAGGAVDVAVVRRVEPGAELAERRSMSGSPSAARLSRVDRPAGMAARLFSTSPPCFLTCRADHRLDAGALVGVEVAAGDEVVGQRPGLVAGPGLEGGDELAPGRSGRSGARAGRRAGGGRRRWRTLGKASRDAGTGDGRSAPTSGACGRGRAARLDYLMRDRPMQPRRGRSGSRPPPGAGVPSAQKANC